MEFIGTAILAFAIVGSGIMATNLTSDSAIRLLINAISTAIGLAVVIRIGIKVSGSHFNPAVTLVMLFLKKIDARLSLFFILPLKSWALLPELQLLTLFLTKKFFIAQ